MVTISGDVGSPGPPRSYSVQSRRSQVTLRICGVIDLAGAGLLLLSGALLTLVLVVDAASGKDANVLTTLAGLGALCLFFGAVFAWAGVQMTWNRVYVTRSGITSMNNWIHRAKRAEIARIDIRRSDFGRGPRVIPFVELRDGRSFKLMPLSVAPVNPLLPHRARVHYPLGLDPTRLGRQLEIVDELRIAFGVGGDNYSPPD